MHWPHCCIIKTCWHFVLYGAVCHYYGVHILHGTKTVDIFWRETAVALIFGKGWKGHRFQSWAFLLVFCDLCRGRRYAEKLYLTQNKSLRQVAEVLKPHFWWGFLHCNLIASQAIKRLLTPDPSPQNQYFTGSALYLGKNQQSCRLTSCYFVWSVLTTFKKIKMV